MLVIYLTWPISDHIIYPNWYRMGLKNPYKIAKMLVKIANRKGGVAVPF